MIRRTRAQGPASSQRAPFTETRETPHATPVPSTDTRLN